MVVCATEYRAQRTCIGEFSPWTLGPRDSHLSPLGLNLLSLSFMAISQPINQFLGTVMLIVAYESFWVDRIIFNWFYKLQNTRYSYIDYIQTLFLSIYY